VASYHTETGYPQDLDYFNAGVDNPPLHALQDGVDSPNGVYEYDPPRGPGGFPTQSFRASNYYVDVVFATSIQCNDGNPCTSDSCDPAVGCVNAHKADGTSCDDSNACTQTDTCEAGQCQGGSAVVCAALDQCHVAGTCDPASGACDNPTAEDGTSCTDGNACTGGDTCNGGSCAAGAPFVCDDQNVCTADSCDTAVGCIHEPLTGGETSCGTGACRRTITSCLNGEPQTCTPGDPTPEVCDGLDNDCDGTPDNGNPGGGESCSTGQQGVCAAGTTACVSGAVACEQSAPASVEVCDGLDNDCDGTPDNGNPGGGESCSTGQQGVCAAGTTACVNGAVACEQNAQPSAEVCNGLDDDCDGTPDNGNPGGGQVCGTDVGACEFGVTACSGGSLACVGGIGAVPEICDGADNNCDGAVDEEPAAAGSCDDHNPATVDACVQGACQHTSGSQVNATCKMTPTRLNVRSEGRTVGFQVLLTDAVTGQAIDPLSLAPVHISKFVSPSLGTIELPTPDTGPGCVQDGIWENPAMRSLLSDGKTMKIVFDQASDGNCETLDGNRQDIIAVLLDALDNEKVRIFISSTYPGASGPIECGSEVVIENRGAR
jgi:hypothetical protein